jgi:hypothetical protein
MRGLQVIAGDPIGKLRYFPTAPRAFSRFAARIEAASPSPAVNSGRIAAALMAYFSASEVSLNFWMRLALSTSPV